MLLGSRNAQYLFAIQIEKNCTHSRVQAFNKLHKTSSVEVHENKPADVTLRRYRVASKI